MCRRDRECEQGSELERSARLKNLKSLKMEVRGMKSASFLLGKLIKTLSIETLHLSQVLNISTVVRCNIRQKSVLLLIISKTCPWKDPEQLSNHNAISVTSSEVMSNQAAKTG